MGVILVILAYPRQGLTYPQFINHGYHSCLTCHYNPHGGGMLNDYGRALSATKISARWLHPPSKTEEQIAEESGFLYRKPDTSWLRVALKYRGLGLRKNQGGDNAENEYIHMLGRGAMTLKLGERDQFLLSGNLDYAPNPRSGIGADEDNYRSREHWIGWRPVPGLGFYAGLMDKVFGLRVPDHIAYSRVIQGTTMNDQTHGIVTHLLWGDFDFGVQGFAGNLSQREELRQKGYSANLEYLLAPRKLVGLSVLSSKSALTSQDSWAVHSRLGMGQASAIMMEIGQREREVIGTNTPLKSRYVFFQGHLQLQRGVSLLQTVEWLTANTAVESKVLRLGPGLQIFAHKGLELRFDFYNTRFFNEEAVADDSWDLAGQVHLWF
jgi:hypothetical protein